MGEITTERASTEGKSEERDSKSENIFYQKIKLFDII